MAKLPSLIQETKPETTFIDSCSCFIYYYKRKCSSTACGYG